MSVAQIGRECEAPYDGDYRYYSDAVVDLQNDSVEVKNVDW
jgi:hypothetical protein